MMPSELKVMHHQVELPRLRMHYVEAGPATGPVVLLLHGFPETWWSWRHQLQPLADAGLRVIAPDLRGYGETDKQGPFDVDTLVADVCALIESLGGPRQVKVVGHDWGGALAWHLASTRPEFCERLAVLNCPHPVLLRQALVSRPKWAQIKRSWYMLFFQLPWLPEYLLTRHDAGNLVRMLRAAAIDRTNFGADELRPFRDAIQRPGAVHAMLGWYRAAMRAALVGRNTHSPLITATTLLLWGLGDTALGYDDVVPGTERFASRLTIETIEGCGHFVHAERPDRVNPLLLRFLLASPSAN
jgi:pimeloyl-ACP methyl ester carboxylesterase